MKTKLRYLPVLFAGLNLMLPCQMMAQTFTNLHSFAALVSSTNSDGANPKAGLVLAGNTLYGTTANGGVSGNGTVFKINTDGGGFTPLYSFTGGDGANPQADLILSGNTLYGTAMNGGSSSYGTIFAINTDSTGFTNLHSFAGSDGSHPPAGLALSGDTLYGTTSAGGGTVSGTLFTINTNGTGFSVFYRFSATDVNGNNSDGANPQAGIIVTANNTVFGTAAAGGSIHEGTVFRLDSGGTGWWTSFNFFGIGEYPQAGLVLSSNTLYGTSSGPPFGIGGTVFAINADNSNPRSLYNFTGGSDGGKPLAGLIISGKTLYGTTSAGGNSGNGTVFKINTDNTGFTTLYSFSAVSGSGATNSDGAKPQADLVLSGNALYGTTSAGGASGNGTVFSISLPVARLTIIPVGKNMVLMWPTNTTGFTLEFATNLVSPTVWNTNSTAPVVISGQNVVTNPISGTQMFFRLSQ